MNVSDANEAQVHEHDWDSKIGAFWCDTSCSTFIHSLQYVVVSTGSVWVMIFWLATNHAPDMRLGRAVDFLELCSSDWQPINYQTYLKGRWAVDAYSIFSCLIFAFSHTSCRRPYIRHLDLAPLVWNFAHLSHSQGSDNHLSLFMILFVHKEASYLSQSSWDPESIIIIRHQLSKTHQHTCTKRQAHTYLCAEIIIAPNIRQEAIHDGCTHSTMQSNPKHKPCWVCCVRSGQESRRWR